MWVPSPFAAGLLVADCPPGSQVCRSANTKQPLQSRGRINNFIRLHGLNHNRSSAIDPTPLPDPGLVGVEFRSTSSRLDLLQQYRPGNHSLQ